MAYRKASYRQRYRGIYRVVHKMAHIVRRHIVERYREHFGTSALVTGILQEFFGGLTYQEGSYLDCHRAVYRDVYRNERYEKANRRNVHALNAVKKCCRVWTYFR